MNKKRNFSKKALRDFDLIDLAIKSNDQNAFKKLMNHYKSSIYFTILKMINNTDDAEDLTNEAFSKAFNKLNKFKKDYTFSTWLFKIAINNTIDFIRKKKLITTTCTKGTYQLQKKLLNEHHVNFLILGTLLLKQRSDYRSNYSSLTLRLGFNPFSSKTSMT